MTDVLSRAIAYIHLNASGIPDAAVNEAHTLDHRLDERHLALESAVHHLEAGVPMREVTVETQLREPAHELNSSPHVLKDRGAMRLHVEGQSFGRTQHGVNQAVRFLVV